MFPYHLDMTNQHHTDANNHVFPNPETCSQQYSLHFHYTPHYPSKSDHCLPHMMSYCSLRQVRLAPGILLWHPCHPSHRYRLFPTGPGRGSLDDLSRHLRHQQDALRFLKKKKWLRLFLFLFVFLFVLVLFCFFPVSKIIWNFKTWIRSWLEFQIKFWICKYKHFIRKLPIKFGISCFWLTGVEWVHCLFMFLLILGKR